MNNILKHIDKLLRQGNCSSKLMLAFKNAANLDEVKEEEKIVSKIKPCKLDKNGWFEHVE